MKHQGCPPGLIPGIIRSCPQGWLILGALFGWCQCQQLAGGVLDLTLYGCWIQRFVLSSLGVRAPKFDLTTPPLRPCRPGGSRRPDGRCTFFCSRSAHYLHPPTGLGERQLILFTPTEQFPVDELTAVVAIQAKGWGIGTPRGVLDGREHPNLCLVLHGPGFGSARGDVSDIKGETEFSSGISALVTDQINLNKSRNSVILFDPCPHRGGAS